MPSTSDGDASPSTGAPTACRSGRRRSGAWTAATPPTSRTASRAACCRDSRRWRPPARSAIGESQIPSFTNPNNLSIVTGAPPAVHGIPGNHYLAPDGQEVQLTSPEHLRAPSIHARFAEAGVQVLAVTTKNKLRALLGAGGVPTLLGGAGPRAGARRDAGDRARRQAEPRHLRLGLLALRARDGAGACATARGVPYLRVADGLRPARRGPRRPDERPLSPWTRRARRQVPRRGLRARTGRRSRHAGEGAPRRKPARPLPVRCARRPPASRRG